MSCPFLRETRVRYCRRASQRKFIPRLAGTPVEELCSTPAFTTCPIYQREPDNDSSASSCPLLHETLMQYCAASSVTHLVPYSEAILSQCGSDSHRYCDLYLELTHPGLAAAGKAIPVEQGLLYTSNHWWVDLPSEGPCHLGLDAFAVRLVGQPERIEYATRAGLTRPVASLTAGGADWQVVFPERARITRCNLYLRSNPERLFQEPYTQGWLFEAELAEDAPARLRRECRAGVEAEAWMEQETRNVNQHVQHLSGFAADGGVFASGILSELGREDAVALFHEFLSPASNERGDASPCAERY